MTAAYYNEIDPFAAAWLRELIQAGLIADGEVDTRSIVDVAADDVRGFVQCHWFAGIGGWSYALRLAGWPDDRPVWTGSAPCQPFSIRPAPCGRVHHGVSPRNGRLEMTARPLPMTIAERRVWYASQAQHKSDAALADTIAFMWMYLAATPEPLRAGDDGEWLAVLEAEQARRADGAARPPREAGR